MEGNQEVLFNEKNNANYAQRALKEAEVTPIEKAGGGLGRIAFDDGADTVEQEKDPRRKLLYGRYVHLLVSCAKCQAFQAEQKSLLEAGSGKGAFTLTFYLCNDCVERNAKCGKTHLQFFHPEWNKFNKDRKRSRK
jgi:hypothetical protein